jgi:subfamily B ATP-binding cassette protein MsbA
LLRLLVYARPYLWVIAVALVFSLLYGGGLTGRAYLLAPIIDEVALPNASLSQIGDLAGGEALSAPEAARQREALDARVRESFGDVLLAGLFLILLMPPTRMVRDYASDWLMTRLYVDLQAAIGEKLLRLPLSHHMRGSRGDFMARVSNDTLIANRAQALIFGDIIHDSAIVLVALVVAFRVNWQLAVILLGVGPPVALVLRIFGRRIQLSSQARQEQVSQVTQRLLQMLSGIKIIKAFHAEEAERRAFEQTVGRYFKRAMKVVKNRVLSRSLVEFVTQASFVILLMIGVWAVLQGLWGLTLGKLGAFVTISALLYRPTKSIGKFYNTVHDALPAAMRVFDVLDAAETPEDRDGAASLSRIEKGVRYRNVHFNYGREAVLSGVDLDVGAGEIVALVGHTGAGKTTIADLLLRFYDPDEGSVEIDGIDLRDMERASLHELVAVVTQEAFLFDGTIFDNIRYGRPEASHEDVVRAATAAFAHEFVSGLPEGYDTEVGDQGVQLSGGQRQRITIARAILRDPQLLVFDEATSALDAKVEGMVQQAIANLMRGRTVLLIAHRLSTVQGADRIAVVENGRVSMSGTHAELMQREGLYREMVELQQRN